MTNPFNLTVGWPVYRDYWTLAPDGSFAATTEQAQYPASLLGRFPVTKVWRGAAVTPGDPVPDEDLVWTSEAAQEIGTIVLVNHNGSANATWRRRVYSDTAMTTLLWDSGTERLWPQVYTIDQVSWNRGNLWYRTYSERERQGQTWTRHDFPPEGLWGRAVKVTFSDPANPAGYLEAGLLEVAGRRQVTVNLDVGHETGFRGRSLESEAFGGAKRHRRRMKPRQDRGRITYMPRDEAIGEWLEMQRQADTNVPFFFCPDPTGVLHALRRNYMARFVDLPLSGFTTATDRNSVIINVEEAL